MAGRGCPGPRLGRLRGRGDREHVEAYRLLAPFGILLAVSGVALFVLSRRARGGRGTTAGTVKASPATKRA